MQRHFLDLENWFSNLNFFLTIQEDAIKDMDKAIILRPDWSKGYERKADYLYRLNRFDEAAQCYTAASQLDPTNQNIKTAIGIIIPRESHVHSKYNSRICTISNKVWLMKE